MAYAERGVTFEWDANLDEDLKGYRLYQSDVPGIYLFGGESLPDGLPNEDFVAEILCGPNDTTCCIYVKDAASGPGKYYVLTAFDHFGNESIPSNEVETLPPGQTENLRFE